MKAGEDQTQKKIPFKQMDIFRKTNMGQRYILNREDYIFNNNFKNALVLKKVLSLNEADSFVKLQTQIASEIEESIHILTVANLIIDSQLRAPGLVLCLAHEDSKLVGYGYGYLDQDKETFYLDTIGVAEEIRNRKVGTEIIAKLIWHAFDDSKVRRIKAVTQTNNEKTIHIIKKMGFKLDS